MKHNFKFIILIAGLVISNLSMASASLPKSFESFYYAPSDVQLRAGYIPESSSLKACVLYLQGLGDSVLNHDPYFSTLSKAGYRIISFDYMGQGGSSGSMNDTRIRTIIDQAHAIWNHYADVRNDQGQDCRDSKKLVIGWSTGGLAAYQMAFENQVDGVVLLAPGIHPKYFVGQAAENRFKIWPSFDILSEDTWTRNKFIGVPNPHVDPIRPGNPYVVPLFAMNLKLTSLQAAHWKINSRVQGLVLLAGREELYLNRDETVRTLKKNASHFEIKIYEGALHELDNELPEVAQDVARRTANFFDEVLIDDEIHSNGP